MNWKQQRNFHITELEKLMSSATGKRLVARLENKRVYAYRMKDGSNLFVVKQLIKEERVIHRSLHWISDETVQAMAQLSSLMNAPHGKWEES